MFPALIYIYFFHLIHSLRYTYNYEIVCSTLFTNVVDVCSFYFSVSDLAEVGEFSLDTSI